MRATQLPWMEPLAAASGIDGDLVLLYSATESPNSFSYIACNPADKIEDNNFIKLASKITSNKSKFDNCWFGYMGYGLKNSLENMPQDEPGALDFPDLCMVKFNSVYEFDHDRRIITLWSDCPVKTLNLQRQKQEIPGIAEINSNMTRAEYLQNVSEIIEKICQGDLYQANLTRKFTGSFTQEPQGLSLFAKLCAVSPAAYSAYMRIGENQILSSSPEMFLKISPDGKVDAQPIKGTSPRFDDLSKDNESREWLRSSEKNKAENLMIVDLMRNDLSKTCAPGSIKAEKMFEITTHATIHHMSSMISGEKLPQSSSLDVIMASFPPGSMTGAPKIKAMQICSALEKQRRGVYSGAIGWLGGDGSAELSVVIRTLLLKGNKFEFQVGGGIVADSTPENELMEIAAKAKGICAALGIDSNHLLKI